MAKKKASKKAAAKKTPHKSAPPMTLHKQPPGAEPTLVIENVPVDSISFAAVNARAHDDRNIDAIKASFLEFGQVAPLLVRKEDNTVVGGNGRLRAVRELGWQSVAVIKLTMSELKAKNLGISLNRTAELAHWDYETLSQIAMELRDEGVDLGRFGWSDEELDAVFKPDKADLEAAAFGDDEDDAAGDPAPAPAEAADPAQGGAVHVRMVQLFFDENGMTDFNTHVENASKVLGTTTPSDTVLAALRQVCGAVAAA